MEEIKHTSNLDLEERTADDLAELFSTLADPTRVRILLILLQGEQNTSTLAQMVGLSDAAVSHQLRGLRQMHIVRPRRQGREVYYTLDDDHVADLLRRGWEHISHG